MDSAIVRCKRSLVVCRKSFLHTTDKMSQPTTKVYYRKECGAKDGTKANLTEDVFQLLIVVKVLLFHIH